MVFEIVSALEEMTIALLVPSHVGEMPSAWHAWRLRRGLTPSLAPLASNRR
jgi:hypothetical protein